MIAAIGIAILRAVRAVWLTLQLSAFIAIFYAIVFFDKLRALKRR